MKHFNRTSSLILGVLIVIAFTLASCQKEDINLEHSSHVKVKPELKIVKLTNKDIIQNKGVTQKLNFFTETLKTRQQNKTVYSSEHDFYINTDFATYIEKTDGSHTYTFPVQYANETGEINNLVLLSQDDGTYNTLYVSYDVTENEKTLINNGMPVNLEGKISIALIDDAIFIDSLFSKVTTIDQCLIPIYSLGACDAGSTYWHDPEPFSDGNGMCSGSQLTLVNVSTDMDCLNDADTGSPGSDGTSSTGDTGNPNGGGLNFDPNAPVTTPVTCEGCPEVDEDEEDCLPVPDDVLATMTQIFGAGNFVYDCNMTADETISVSSAEDIEALLESLLLSETVEVVVPDSDSDSNSLSFLREDTIVKKFSSFPQTEFVAKMKMQVPNNPSEVLKLVFANIGLEGNLSLHDWTQTDGGDPLLPDGPYTVTDYGVNSLRIYVDGEILVGLNISGYPFKSKKYVTFITTYDLTTNLPKDEYCYWIYNN